MIFHFLLLLGCKAGNGVAAPVKGVTDPGFIEELFEETDESSESDSASMIDECDSPITEVVEISLDSTRGCAWGEDGNLDERDRYLQARYEQNKEYVAPRKICDVRLEFERGVGSYSTEDWYYSDHAMLLLDQQVIFSTSTQLVNSFPIENDVLIYSWESIAGQDLFVNGDSPWVLGEESSTLSVPNDGENGVTYIEIASESLRPLISRAIEDNNLRFTMATFGDNDTDDCMHSGFFFTIEVDRAP